MTARAPEPDTRPHPSRTAPAIRVPVALGARSYEILVGRGLLADAGSRIAALGVKRAAIVTDETVGAIHGGALAESLAEAGIRASEIRVPPGETSKGWGSLERVVEALIAERIERGDVVVALGGGVVGDLAGFSAAILRRGVRLVQAPTTLLAQVDSSVGGKTGINSPNGKNLIGAFHQPSLVLADTAALDTLPAREMRAGYAETAKYGLIDDPAFFAWCEANWRAIFAGQGAREEAVAASCRAKAAVVARDEREDGDRALLNLGHTFAHALEAAVGYDAGRLVHGEAVAIGICLAFRFSARLGLCADDEARRVAAHFDEVGLPTRLSAVPGGVGTPDSLLAAMAQDKKVRDGALTFILANGIGLSFIARGVERAKVFDFLTAEAALNAPR